VGAEGKEPTRDLLLKQLKQLRKANRELEARNEDLQKWVGFKGKQKAVRRDDQILYSHDGDTVTLKGLGRCRILGIDTPETWEKNRAGKWVRRANPDPRGLLAYEFLRSLEGQSVRVGFDQEKRDKHGRALVHLYLLPNGPDLASHILRQGWARPLAIAPNLSRKADHRADAKLGKPPKQAAKKKSKREKDA
jgi:endonuclease YncB( thermonuclease family)